MALLLVAGIGGLVAAAGPSIQGANLPDPQTLPLPLGQFEDLATGAGIGLVIAMLAGRALGGGLGARWHSKLENSELVHQAHEAPTSGTRVEQVRKAG